MTSFGDADDDTEIVFSNEHQASGAGTQGPRNASHQAAPAMASKSIDTENAAGKQEQSPSGAPKTKNTKTDSSSPEDKPGNGLGAGAADAVIKYDDDHEAGSGSGSGRAGHGLPGKPNFAMEVSSDLDSDNEVVDDGTAKGTPVGSSPNLTPHGAGMHTPNSQSSRPNLGGPKKYKPMLRPSPSQRASERREVSTSSPRHRPELNAATTSSKKPQLDVHDIRHFARNNEVADDYAYLSTEMEPNPDEHFANNLMDEDPPILSEEDGPKQRLNSASKGGPSSGGSSITASSDPKVRLIEKLRHDKSIASPICVVSDWLYIGDCMNAAHISQIKSHGITHILNVSDKVPCYFLDNAEIKWKIDYARIPIPNLEYSLVYDYFKAAVQFIDIVNPDEDTVQIEKDISRNDRRDENYDFGDDEMVVLNGGLNGGGSGGAIGTGSGGASGAPSALDVLTEGKEMEKNLDDANDMEFAFDSDCDTNENSMKKDASHSPHKDANKSGLAHSIELGNDSGNPMDNVNAKKTKNHAKKQGNNTMNGGAGAGANGKQGKNNKRKEHGSENEKRPINSNHDSENTDNNNNNYKNEYHDRYKGMKRKILIHSGNSSSRSASVTMAYFVARQVRFSNEEIKLINNIRIELFRQNPKFTERIREKKPMEPQNRYINDLIYELERRELHLMFYFNDKRMRQLRKMLKKQEKAVSQQMEQLKQNNLSPDSSKSGALRLVSQSSTYTDHLRIMQLKHQTDIYALGYVGGMSLAVAYKFVLAQFEMRYGIGYFRNHNNNRKNNNNAINGTTPGIGDANDADHPILNDKPNTGFVKQLSIWEKKKRHGMDTMNELPDITNIRKAIHWVKDKDRSHHIDPVEHPYSDTEDDVGPIPPEPVNHCCTCAIQ